ncbi:MAG: hypothetical protein RJB62_303 [Pseudomonadota bacterium]|jgi:hypothetical protein
MLITFFLLLHGLMAIVLLGAITHQAFAVSLQTADRSTMTARFRSVDPAGYTNSVVILFALTSLLGAILYPQYRIVVRPALVAIDFRAANGAFEMKEQFVALALGMLPAYWSCWMRAKGPEYVVLRRCLTWLLTVIAWWSFFVGHILNNIQGLSPWTA